MIMGRSMDPQPLRTTNTWPAISHKPSKPLHPATSSQLACNLWIDDARIRSSENAINKLECKQRSLAPDGKSPQNHVQSVKRNFLPVVLLAASLGAARSQPTAHITVHCEQPIGR